MLVSTRKFCMYSREACYRTVAGLAFLVVARGLSSAFDDRSCLIKPTPRIRTTSQKVQMAYIEVSGANKFIQRILLLNQKLLMLSIWTLWA